jgi:hypothetical protein
MKHDDGETFPVFTKCYEGEEMKEVEKNIGNA